ncbi:MAG: hypothetical protein AAF899_03050 [Pseudomonadota bacterium]
MHVRWLGLEAAARVVAGLGLLTSAPMAAACRVLAPALPASVGLARARPDLRLRPELEGPMVPIVRLATGVAKALTGWRAMPVPPYLAVVLLVERRFIRAIIITELSSLLMATHLVRLSYLDAWLILLSMGRLTPRITGAHLGKWRRARGRTPLSPPVSRHFALVAPTTSALRLLARHR